MTSQTAKGAIEARIAAEIYSAHGVGGVVGIRSDDARGTAFRYRPGCMHGHHDLVQSQKRSSNLVMLALFGQHQESARSKVNIRETASPDDRVVFATPSRRIARARQHYPDDAQACSNNVVVTGIRLLVMQLAPFRIDRPGRLAGSQLPRLSLPQTTVQRLQSFFCLFSTRVRLQAPV